VLGDLAAVALEVVEAQPEDLQLKEQVLVPAHLEDKEAHPQLALYHLVDKEVLEEVLALEGLEVLEVDLGQDPDLALEDLVVSLDPVLALEDLEVDLDPVLALVLEMDLVVLDKDLEMDMDLVDRLLPLMGLPQIVLDKAALVEDREDNLVLDLVVKDLEDSCHMELHLLEEDLVVSLEDKEVAKDLDLDKVDLAHMVVLVVVLEDLEVDKGLVVKALEVDKVDLDLMEVEQEDKELDRELVVKDLEMDKVVLDLMEVVL